MGRQSRIKRARRAARYFRSLFMNYLSLDSEEERQAFVASLPPSDSLQLGALLAPLTLHQRALQCPTKPEQESAVAETAEPESAT